jgi:hypothetical protein
MSNLIQFPGSGTQQPKGRAEHAWERRERLASRDREAVLRDIDRHIHARQAYAQAVAWTAAAEAEGLPPADIEAAHQGLAELFAKMQEAGRNLLVVMPTDLKALVDLLLYLEKNFSVLPQEVTHGAGAAQPLAFDLLRTVRLSLREIAKYGKHGPTS